MVGYTYTYLTYVHTYMWVVHTHTKYRHTLFDLKLTFFLWTSIATELPKLQVVISKLDKKKPSASFRKALSLPCCSFETVSQDKSKLKSW